MPSKEPQQERWPEVQEAFNELTELDPERLESGLAELRERDGELASLVADLLRHDAGPDEAPPAPRFGPYVALRRIGSGGMGEVHLAQRSDGAFEREVAVKVIRQDVVSAHVVERFLRERQTLAELDHDSIVRLLDGGTTDEGRPYLVMEHVDGVPLDQYVADRMPSVGERMELLRRIAVGVAHAHERGVVHRDLKPSNVLVREDGQPRLLDFGIARSLAPRADSDAPEAAALTRTGHRLFTPRYASPEQIRGEEATAAADVFALGVLMYELLAGVSPWKPDGSEFELEREIEAADPVRPSRRAGGTTRLGVTADLDTIALKALAAEARHRYADAGELAADLGRALAGEPILARRQATVERGWRLLKRRPWHAVAAVAIALAASAWFVAARQEHAATRRRAELVSSVPTRLDVIHDLVAEGRTEVAESALLTFESETAHVDLPAMDQAQLLLIRARVLQRRRDWAGSLESVQEAAQLSFDSSSARGGRVATDIEYERGNALAALGRFEESEAVLRRALADTAESFGQSHRLAVGVEELLGRVLARARRTDEAIEVFRSARQHAAEGGDDLRMFGARAALGLGRALGDLFREAEAIEALEEALATYEWRYGKRDLHTAEVLVFLGRSYHGAGRREDALGVLQTAARAYEDLRQPLRELLTRRMVIDLALEMRRTEEARKHIDRADEIIADGGDQLAVSAPQIDLGRGRIDLMEGAPERALISLRRCAEATSEEGRFPSPRAHAEALAFLAQAQAETGDLDGAIVGRVRAVQVLRDSGVAETDALLQGILKDLDR